MRLRPATLAFAALLALPAAAQTPITLEQAMAHPDWIGPPVENAYWNWDGKQAIYQLKRNGSPVRDTLRQSIEGGEARRVDAAELATLDAPGAVLDRTRSREVFVRHGDVFERDLRSGALTQVTRSAEDEASPQFAADGRRVQYRIGANWYSWDPATRIGTPVALPVLWPAEEAAPAADALRAWRLVSPRVEIETIPGDHLSAITAHADALAERLARCLGDG